MKSLSSIFVLIFLCATVTVASAQHSLQLDDGLGHFSFINAPNPGGTYTLWPGGGTILTAPPAGQAALVWLTHGNYLTDTDWVNNILGTMDNHNFRIISNASTRIAIAADGTMGINDSAYALTTIGNGSANTQLTINGSANASSGDSYDPFNTAEWDLNVQGDMAVTGVSRYGTSGASIWINGTSSPNTILSDNSFTVGTNSFGDLSLATNSGSGGNVNLNPDQMVILNPTTGFNNGSGFDSRLRIEGPGNATSWDFGVDPTAGGQLGFIESGFNNFGFYINSDNTPTPGGTFSINFNDTHVGSPTNVFFAQGNGQVGIGTNSPNAGVSRLEVVGNGTNTGYGDVLVQNSVSAGLGAVIGISNPNAAVGTAGALQFDVDGTNFNPPNAEVRAININGGVNNATDLAFSIWNGVGFPEVMRVLNTGNVGIGTTTANALLSFGAHLGVPIIHLWDGGPTDRYGFGINSSELQTFVPAGANFSWNAGADLQPSGTNQLMRLAGNATLSIGSQTADPASPSADTRLRLLSVSGNSDTWDYGVVSNGDLGYIESNYDNFGIWLDADANVSGAAETFTINRGNNHTAGTQVFKVDGGGNVTVGNFAADGSANPNVVTNVSGVLESISASSLAALTSWSLTGNTGTTPGTNFLGTTDNNAFEIHVFNGDVANQGSKRVMRYEPNVASPNLIGGYQGNAVTPGFSSPVGAVIGGGGSNGLTNQIVSTSAPADYDVVGGGQNNVITDATGSVIAGGQNNEVKSGFSGVPYSNVSGGSNNDVYYSGYSNIAGGSQNAITGTAAANGANNAIGGGLFNTIQNTGSNIFSSNVIAGGDNNAINANTASVSQSTISGGGNNTITDAANATIGGGIGNSVSIGADNATIGGGTNNVSGALGSTVGGGSSNSILAGGDNSVIPGGNKLTISGANTFGFLGATGNPMSIAGTSKAVFANTDLWLANNNNSASALYFYAPNTVAGAFPDVTSKYVGFMAGAVTTSVIWTLPLADATSANQALTSNAAGVLGWSTVALGSGTLNTIPKWTPNGNTLGNSLLTDNGTTLAYNGTTIDQPTVGNPLTIQTVNNPNGATGTLTVTTGFVGGGAGSGVSGDLDLSTGGNLTNAAPGTINISGGGSLGFGTTNHGGNVAIAGGSSNNGNGGNVSLTSGSGSLGGNGGNVSVSLGTGAANGSFIVNGTSSLQATNPQLTNTYDLGTTSLRWGSIRLAGAIDHSLNGDNPLDGDGAGHGVASGGVNYQVTSDGYAAVFSNTSATTSDGVQIAIASTAGANRALTITNGANFNPTGGGGNRTEVFRVLDNGTTFIGNLPASASTTVVTSNAGTLESRSMASLVGATGWALIGNSVLVDGTNNLLGRTDNGPIRLITNNILREYIAANGDIGVGNITAPISLLSNTTASTTGSDGESGAPDAISWSSTSITPGFTYAGTLFNANNIAGFNGLEVKVASNAATTFALDVSQNATQGTAGTALFNVRGNGNVNIGVNSATTTAINSQTVTVANIPSASSATNVVVSNAGALETRTFASLASPSWSLTGNAGLVDGTNNLLGTTDAQPVKLISGVGPNTRMLIAAAGDISVSNNFYPMNDNTQSLGLSTNRWQELFVGPASLHLYQLAAEGDGINIRNYAFGINGSGILTLSEATSGKTLMRIDATNNFSIGIGADANALGNTNTAIGFSSMQTNTGLPVGNTAVGVTSLSTINAAGDDYNTAIGREAGFNIENGHASGGGRNTFLGADADVPPGAPGTGITNSTGVGFQAVVTAANMIQLGNSSVTLVNTSGNIHTAGQLQMQGTGTGYTALKAGAQGAANITYIMPTANGAAGQVLSTDGGGPAQLSWANAGSYFFAGNSDGNVAANNFFYMGKGQNAAEANTQIIMPRAGHLTNLHVHVTVVPGGAASQTFTVRVNGIATLLSATIPAASTDASDAHIISVNAGDLISTVNTQAGGPAAANAMVSFEIAN
ncbi:MAG TPA: hypothetical protein VEW28_07435 [Candidatus Kapabacteria bacterium]|nr:hypothetical protein [Candidatus Kapabacteria bacterium]